LNKFLDILKTLGKIAAICALPILIDNVWFMRKIGYKIDICPCCNRELILMQKE